MKTIKSIATSFALIATFATATTVSACPAIADNDIVTVPIQELDPVSLASFMDNPYANSFCNFRIVTNAHMEDINTVIAGDDAFLFSDWGFYSETPEVIVLFNTKGTTDATDDEIIQVYEPPIDEVSELNLYESIYNDMWSLR